MPFARLSRGNDNLCISVIREIPLNSYQFLLIARGSLMELETHLIIAQQLNYVSQEHFEHFQEAIENTSKMLNRLIQALRAR